MADHLSPWTKTFTRDTSKDIYEEVSYDTTKPKFDEVVISTDLLTAGVSYSKPCFITYDHDSKVIYIRDIEQCQSGTTTPTTAIPGILVYYNTSENKIYCYENNAWIVKLIALPLAIVSVQNATPYITSINQVFNGFGYIGSTIFALPGVKGLIPNGRNADGTLKNIEFTLNKVVLGTYADTLTTSGEPMLVGDNQGNITKIDYKNVYGKDYWHYEEAENKWYFEKNQKNWAEIGSAKWSSGKITSFTPKTAFHAVDRNDSSWLSGLGMPSNRYIDLTLGASDTTYTAPANGWFYVRMSMLKQYGYIEWYNNTNTLCQTDNYSDGTPYKGSVFRCKKGDEVNLKYSGLSTTQSVIFRFVYAEGEN